jgi:diguanylate cyclase (GGDEF)-like protein
LNNPKPLILIVEDSSVNSRICEKLLNKQGFATFVCSDAETAINYINIESPDLILLDIIMPGIDGYEFCAMIKNNLKIKDTPIIFLSAMHDEKSIIKGFECGGVDFVTKPFRHQELLARIRTHIELKKAKENLLRMATTDELTRLANRRHFMDRLNEEYERSRRNDSEFTMLMIDIDYFKRVNDTFGHQAGDAVLRMTSDIMKHNLRLSDILGRIGGEEFAVLLPDTEIKEGVIIAERLRKKIENLGVPYNQSMINITISIGASNSLTDDSGIDSILQRSDTALYRAKEYGRNQTCSYN